MLNQTIALVFALLMHYSPALARGADRSAIVGIARMAADPSLHVTREELADEVLYAALESNMKDHPRPLSWDARGGVSCGMLQEPCWYVRDHNDEEQAKWWLRNMRDAGLAAVDSDPKRAARRAKLAVRLLQEVDSCPWHAGLLAQVFAPARDLELLPVEQKTARLVFFVEQPAE